jgi:hypothetical protein
MAACLFCIRIRTEAQKYTRRGASNADRGIAAEKYSFPNTIDDGIVLNGMSDDV